MIITEGERDFITLFLLSLSILGLNLFAHLYYYIKGKCPGIILNEEDEEDEDGDSITLVILE